MKYTDKKLTPKLRLASKAEVKLGSWLSAALDDSKVCDEMKADIRVYFSEIKYEEEVQNHRDSNGLQRDLLAGKDKGE